MPTLDETIALASELHAGQDDLTGEPYINHPLAVMLALPPEATDDDRHLALLHDTIEDSHARIIAMMQAKGLAFDPSSPMTCLEFFRSRHYSNYVIEGLMLLTRDMWSGWTYLSYIRNIIASGHHGAMLVKYFDNCHNSDPDRLARVLPKHVRSVPGLVRRYQRSKALLAAALGRVE